MPGGLFSWTGQGNPSNDPFGKGLPAGWSGNIGIPGTGQGFIWGPNGISVGPVGGGGMGSPLGGMGGSMGGGGGLGAGAPAPGSGGIGPTGTGLDPSGGNPGSIQQGTAF